MKIVLISFLALMGIQSLVHAQTATPIAIQKEKTLLLSSQADLVISIKSIVHNGNNYTVKFIVRNQGGGAVDLRQVFVQGHVYASNGSMVSAGGGLQLLNYGSLNKLQEVEAQLLFTSQAPLLNTESYVYRLKADDKNTVAEADENNNSAEMKFTGNSVPAATMANLGMQNKARAFVPDLVIQVTSITRFPAGSNSFVANYTIKNIGNGNCNLKEYSVQGYVRENGAIDFSPAGGESLMYDGIVLEPGKEFKFSRGISANLASNKVYRYKLELINQKPSQNNFETNYSNNSWELNFSTSN